MNTNRLFFFLSIALLFSCAQSTLKCMENSDDDADLKSLDLLNKIFETHNEISELETKAEKIQQKLKDKKEKYKDLEKKMHILHPEYLIQQKTNKTKDDKNKKECFLQ